MWIARVSLLLCCLALAGCSSLLPRGTAAIESPFDSFEAARDAIEDLVPYQSTVADLTALGYSLDDSSNVTQIPYPQLIGHVFPNPSVPFEALDQGIQDCILARQACRAYRFQFARERRERVGNFLLDFLNFQRNTVFDGWRFEGLIVVRDNLVLFRNFGGEPRMDRRDRQINPLGPLQPAGEAASRLIVR